MNNNKMVYVIDGTEEVSTLKEVCDILGVKVTKKQVLNGEIESVVYTESTLAQDEVATDTEDSLVDDINAALEEEVDTEESDEPTDEVVEEEVIEPVVEEPVVEEVEPVVEAPVEEKVVAPVQEPVVEEKVAEEKIPTAKPSKLDLANMTLEEKLALVTKPSQAKKKASAQKFPIDKEIDFPEVGHFGDKDELKEYYKMLQDAHLDQWIELEGLEWKQSNNAGIDRMRRCMAITNLHFPSQSKSKKSKSKYAQYTTEQLLELCLDNDVEVADGKGNTKILRMYCIMELRKAGVIE